MVVEKTKNCTSCGLCIVSCPKQCLTMELNKDGFYRPVLKEEDRCSGCGICDLYCPANFNIKDKEPLLQISATMKDQKKLMTVSSGGICFELAKKGLESGQSVCGCVYDYESHRAVHQVINSLEDLESTKGSKYFQSYTPEAFSKIFDGREWVVFGTPCQMAAVDSYATKKGVRDKLLLVDFFCHGTPTMNLWDKYILENGKEQISKIDFRSKEFGWHNFSLKFTYKDGKTKSDFKENMFYNFFFNNLALNDSCYECKYKALKTKADIRVGDYWGEKFKKNVSGVSCCVALSEKGKTALERVLIDCDWESADLQDILKAQMIKSPMLLRQRKKVLNAFKGKKSLKAIHNTTLFSYRLKCKIKSLLKRK